MSPDHARWQEDLEVVLRLGKTPKDLVRLNVLLAQAPVSDWHASPSLSRRWPFPCWTALLLNATASAEWSEHARQALASYGAPALGAFLPSFHSLASPAPSSWLHALLPHAGVVPPDVFCAQITRDPEWDKSHLEHMAWMLAWQKMLLMGEARLFVPEGGRYAVPSVEAAFVRRCIWQAAEHAPETLTGPPAAELWARVLLGRLDYALHTFSANRPDAALQALWQAGLDATVMVDPAPLPFVWREEWAKVAGRDPSPVPAWCLAVETGWFDRQGVFAASLRSHLLPANRVPGPGPNTPSARRDEWTWGQDILAHVLTHPQPNVARCRVLALDYLGMDWIVGPADRQGVAQLRANGQGYAIFGPTRWAQMELSSLEASLPSPAPKPSGRARL